MHEHFAIIFPLFMSKTFTKEMTKKECFSVQITIKLVCILFDNLVLSFVLS